MFKLHLQYSQLAETRNDFHAMVRCTGESVLDEMETLPAKSILYLLDVSGSLDVKKVKESITRSLPFFRSNDEVCVISFSTETSIDIPWTFCTITNKHRIVDQIVNIQTGGWSNISNGIFHAISQCMEKNDAHIVILSDGEPNSGVVDGEKLVNMIKNTLHGTNNRIHAFGHGNHESELLRELSDACSGTYNFIRSSEELPAAYGSVLGAVMSTVCQGLQITVQSDTLLFTDIENKTHTNFYVGDLYAHEKRDTLFKCHVIHPSPEHRIDYTVKGFNLLTGDAFTYSGHQVLSRGRDNMQCELVCNRIEEMRIIKELSRARNESSVQNAVDVLSRVKTPMKSLQEDIDLVIGSRNCEYSMKSLLSRIEQEYTQQRDNRSDDLLSDYYTPFRMWTSREVSHNNN